MKIFLILWLTQSFSALGSSMTAYALIIWSYNQKGSALATASLMVCSYAPYVIFSVFAGALSDSWNKKFTMHVCDSITALTTIIVLVLLISNRLEIWHIYVINAVGGVMNTVHSPASEVAVTKILPETKKSADFVICQTRQTLFLRQLLQLRLSAFSGLKRLSA